MKHISCRGCREWFDAASSSCPHCQWVRPGYNSWLHTVRLNNALYAQAEASKPHNEFAREHKRIKGDLDRIARDL